MTRFVAVATALLALATTTVGCVPFGCGVADDYDKGTDGQWVLTRMLSGYDCPVQFDFEQMTFEIRGDVVTVTSANQHFDSARVYQDGDRQLVEITVDEDAVLTIDAGGQIGTRVPFTYSLELVPATARLEGTMTSDYFVDPGGSCDYHGTASAGRVAD